MSESNKPITPGGGWLGAASQVYHYLATVGADKDADGKYLIGRAPVTSFLGLGDELCVPAETVYYVGGKPAGLAAGLNSTSYGVRNVTVIS